LGGERTRGGGAGRWGNSGKREKGCGDGYYFGTECCGTTGGSETRGSDNTDESNPGGG